MQKKQKGFTLLEILLVITVVGILAAIVLVAINPNRQINQAKQVAINGEKIALEKALQERFIITRNYPTGIDGVQRKICSATVNTDCIDIASDLVPDYIVEIPTGAEYTVARGNSGEITVGSTQTALNLSCPTGYIPVPGNTLYNTEDFCVMKYEAKAVAISNPTVGLTTPSTAFNTISNNITATTSANGRTIASIASGFPIANIDQSTAAQYCTNAGASLISNAEWMTIARNIEAQLSNWTTGTAASSSIGIGGLYRGHSDNTPLRALVAGPDTDGYIGTGESGFNIQRRTHTLSNGEIIWDLAGNVWEWPNDTIMAPDKPTALSSQFTDITGYGTLSYDLTRPSNPLWNSTQNMGQYYAGGLTGGPFVFLRGGAWNSLNGAGIFTLDLAQEASAAFNFIGFRCVVR